MTRQETIQKLTELKAKAESLALDYNAAYGDSKFDEVSNIEKDMDKAIEEYNETVRALCFEDCCKSDDPMIAAVTALTYVTIRTHDDDNKETKTRVRTIEERARPIDLGALHKYRLNSPDKKGIGHDEKWLHMGEKLNFLMTVRAAERLGIKDLKSISDSYAMAEIARDIDFGKTPTSNTNLIKSLQAVVTAMIGEEYKVTSHDVNYLVDIYCKKSNKKALTVVCANHKYFRNYLAEICHRVVLKKDYGVEYKTKA